LKPKWFTNQAKSTNDQQQSADIKIESDFENSIILPPFTR
jgi:hypothetical protein